MTEIVRTGREAGSRGLAAAFASDRRGATAIEYALIAGGIFLAIVAVVPELGVAVNGLFTEVKSSF